MGMQLTPNPTQFDGKAVASRLLTAAVAAGSLKLAAKTGITIDSDTQISIALGVYAVLHKFIEHLFKRG